MGRFYREFHSFESDSLTDVSCRVVMDVTDKTSIKDVVNHIESIDGLIHVLVNKYVHSFLDRSPSIKQSSAGQVGPRSPFIPDRTQHPTGDSFGNALFDSESFEAWSDHFTANVSSVHFVSMAFLGLLEKGAESRGQTSSIINITSISGIMRLAQDHVSYLSVIL